MIKFKKSIIKKINLVLIFVITFVFISSGAVLAAPYTIKAGDTIWEIAQRYDTGTVALMKANNLKSPLINVGQKIQVPDSSTHFVNYGDTLWEIAEKFGVTLSSILKHNNMKEGDILTIGQIIKIPQQIGPDAKIQQLIKAGLKYLGRPYEFGASNNQTKTFDCSSFTQRAFKDIGIEIKRSSRSQYAYPPGQYIEKSKIKRGDLLFFDYAKDGRIDHVAIYYGNNKLLHTYRPEGVEVGDFSEYWHDRYVGAKRIIK